MITYYNGIRRAALLEVVPERNRQELILTHASDELDDEIIKLARNIQDRRYKMAFSILYSCEEGRTAVAMYNSSKMDGSIRDITWVTLNETYARKAKTEILTTLKGSTDFQTWVEQKIKELRKR